MEERSNRKSSESLGEQIGNNDIRRPATKVQPRPINCESISFHYNTAEYCRGSACSPFYVNPRIALREAYWRQTKAEEDVNLLEQDLPHSTDRNPAPSTRNIPISLQSPHCLLTQKYHNRTGKSTPEKDEPIPEIQASGPFSDANGKLPATYETVPTKTEVSGDIIFPSFEPASKKPEVDIAVGRDISVPKEKTKSNPPDLVLYGPPPQSILEATLEEECLLTREIPEYVSGDGSVFNIPIENDVSDLPDLHFHDAKLSPSWLAELDAERGVE